MLCNTPENNELLKNQYDDLNLAYTGIKLSTALMIKSSTYCVYLRLSAHEC